MEAKNCAVGVVDYAQLHSLSSVVLYDTSSNKLKRGKFYNVERVIERRKTKHLRLILTISFSRRWKFHINFDT